MIGVKVGANYSNLKPITPLNGQGPVVGYSFAGSMETYLHNFLYFQGELAINQKGYVFKDSSFTVRRTFTYLEIPLMLKAAYWRPAISDNFYSLGMGPSLGYALFGYESTDDFTSFHQWAFTNNNRRFDFGGIINLTYGHSFSFGYLTFETRFYKGFLKIENTPNQPKFQTFSFSVGFLFYKPRSLGHRF